MSFQGSVLDYFQNIVQKEPDVSAAVAAIRTLMNILETFGDGNHLKDCCKFCLSTYSEPFQIEHYEDYQKS